MGILGRFRATLGVAAALALVLPVAGCEEDAVRPPMVVVTPAPSVRAVITNPNVTIREVESDNYVALPFELSQAGVLDITVDWTFESSWIYVYFGNARCEYVQLRRGTCPFLITSETTQPKPRVLVTGMLEAGSYFLVVHNVPWDLGTRTGSDNTETITIQIGQTVTTQGRRVPVRIGTPVVGR